MKNVNKKPITIAIISIVLFCITLFVYYLTSAGNTPYDYFTRLAHAFLEGKYWIEENPPWLSELIPGIQNRYYIVHPPMPAIVLAPILIFFKNLPQQYLAHAMGAGISVAFFLASLKVKDSYLHALWVWALVTFGNILWFLSAVGSSWYLGQVSSAFFLSFGILEVVGKKRAIILGLLLGAAYLSRVQAILFLPFFVFAILKDRQNVIKRIVYFLLGIAPFLLFNAIYNYLRFGVPWDIGYTLIPGVLTEPWYVKGIFDFSYIPSNLRVMFTALPLFKSEFPYVTPSWGGLAIWITTPAFVYALWNPIKDRLAIIGWVCTLGVALAIFSHGGTGFTQFGYRYAVDFYPMLFYFVVIGVTKKNLTWHHWLLLSLSILVNTWGVLWINRFGWVSF